MACDICKAYLVKKVHMCEDCYQKLMSLRYKSQEGFAWAQGILTDEFMDETKTCFEKKSKVAQVLKKVLLFIIENF